LGLSARSLRAGDFNLARRVHPHDSKATLPYRLLASAASEFPALEYFEEGQSPQKLFLVVAVDRMNRLSICHPGSVFSRPQKQPPDFPNPFRALYRTRGPVVGQFYIQTIGNYPDSAG
jgi:hypothetical protein